MKCLGREKPAALQINPVVMLWISLVVALWISSGRSCSSWLLNWMLGLYKQKLMTVKQHFLLADGILGVHECSAGLFPFACLIREWLRGDNAGNIK